MRRLNLASPKRLGRFSCGWWRHDGAHGFRSFRALARSAGKADFSGLSVAAFCRREVCVTLVTTSHCEAEMAKVSDDGIFDLGEGRQRQDGVGRSCRFSGVSPRRGGWDGPTALLI